MSWRSTASKEVYVDTDKTMWEFSDLMSVTLRGDDDQGFDTKKDKVPLSTQDVLSDEFLGHCNKMRIRDSEQFKNRTGIDRTRH